MTESNQERQDIRSNLPTDLLIELGLERVRTVGIVLLVLGAVALITPAVAGTLVSLVVGIVLLAAGFSKIVRIFRTGSWREHWEDVLLSFLAIVAGAVIVARPLVGLSVITLSLTVYFAVSGIVQVVWWWRLRPAFSVLWMFLSGVATLLLAVLIGVEWPLSGLWAVGTLVGVHLVFAGASLVALGSPSAGSRGPTTAPQSAPDHPKHLSKTKGPAHEG
jgi:uncharacterized membrane protein HdeD (DUF308 family)